MILRLAAVALLLGVLVLALAPAALADAPSQERVPNGPIGPRMSGAEVAAAAAPETGPAVVYVDAASGSDTNDGSQAAPFKTIGKGIDTVATGGTVNVAAGTYIEDQVVTKSVTLLGPNATVNPNSGTRAAEALILPAVSAPDPSVCEVMYDIRVSDVTIKGFTFDGDNPALTSGILIDGADVDACELVIADYGSANIVIENNIFKHATYAALEFYNYYGTPGVATSGNYIRYNRIEDIGETTYNWGIGILVYNNFYADITDNVLTGVRTGIQTGNFYNANPGTTGSISNNRIGVWRLGIFHNLAYTNASPLTISGNTITAESYSGATKWNGLLLSSMQSAVNAIITNNTIVIPSNIVFPAPGYAAGYNVWNVTTTAPMTISGGKVTGGDYGVFVNNWEGYSSDAGNTAITVDDVKVFGARYGAMYVKDSPNNTNGATVKATVKNSYARGSVAGVRVDGVDASATVNNNLISMNTTGVLVENGATGNFDNNLYAGNTSFGANNTTAAAIDALNSWWNSATGPTHASNPGGTGDKVSDLVNFGGFKTSTTNLQALVDGACNGTLTLGPATYTGGVTIDCPVKIVGVPGTVITPGSPAFTVNAENVEINDLTLSGGGSAFPAILVEPGADNFTMQRLEVNGWADGIQVAGAVTSLKIVNNFIHSNTDAGLQVDAAVAGVQTVEGNLFKANGGDAIKSVAALKAQYNSFASTTCPTTYANVDATNCAFAETFIDVDPTTAGDQFVRNVDESTSFDVKVMVDAKNLYGFAFKFSYDTGKLQKNSAQAIFPAGYACGTLPGLAGNEIGFQCAPSTGNPVINGLVAIGVANFTATGPGLTGPGTWDAYFNVDPVASTAGTANGALVYLNNVKLPGANPRDITDADDGKIVIRGIANFTGFIDVQGRADDSGALLNVYEADTLATPVLATATSAKGGAYTTAHTSGNLLTILTPYYFSVDKVRYVKTWATGTVPTKVLTTRPLTTLNTLVLKGGDANDDEKVDVGDAGLVGGAYGDTLTCPLTGACADVNGDGKVDILDLTLMGGNYGIMASDWTP